MIAALTLYAILATSIPAQGAGDANTRDVESPTPLPVLDESPESWTRADEGRWADWTIDTPPEGVQLEFMRDAALAYAKGDLPASLTALYELLDSEPDYPPALYQSGAIYFRLRRYGDAAYAFRRYLDVAPQRTEDTRALGHALYTLGDYEAAAAHYERVIAAGGEHPEALRGLALSRWRMGDADAALADLDRVLELDPRHDEAHLWRARILYDEDRLDDALAAVEAARERDPYEPQVWFLLSRLQFEFGEDEAADESRTRFLMLDRVEQEARVIESQLLYAPHQPRLRARLVELRASTGDIPAVREALAEWMELDAENVTLRIYALDALTQLGDREGADLAALSLRRLAGDDLDAWKRLARYFATTRQRKEQVEAERKLAELRAAQK